MRTQKNSEIPRNSSRSKTVPSLSHLLHMIFDKNTTDKTQTHIPCSTNFGWSSIKPSSLPFTKDQTARSSNITKRYFHRHARPSSKQTKQTKNKTNEHRSSLNWQQHPKRNIKKTHTHKQVTGKPRSPEQLLLLLLPTRRWQRSTAWYCCPEEHRWFLLVDHVANAWSLASVSFWMG